MKKWNIKKIFKELLVTVLLIAVVSNVASYLRKPTLDSNVMPEKTFTLIDGSTYTLKKGNPLLIHFWATWCNVCSLEASNIQKLSEKYEVLTVAVQSGSIANIQAQMKKEGVSFRVIEDPKGILATKFKVSAYPTDFIYNKEGKLTYTEVGYTTTAGFMLRFSML